MFNLFAFLFAVIDPVNIGNNKYINKNPIIGACANTESSAKQIMQKLIDTGSVQLDEYNSVFARPDIFSGFTVYTAKVYDGHTIFNFSEVTGTKSGQFRFILDFVWERTKSYTQDFVEATRQIITNAFSALREAPQYFSRPIVSEKPKSVLIAELKAQNPIKSEVVDHVRVDQVIPINMGNNQYINRNPIIGACSNTEAGAKKIMQKLIDTQHVLLDAYHSVFARSDIFYGFIIHSAKVHDGHTIFSYSQAGEGTGIQYRFILDFAWETTKHYAQGFIETTRQVIIKAASALKEASQYFVKNPAPAKSNSEFIDQLDSHLDQVWQEHNRVGSWNAQQIKSWKQRFTQQPTGRRNVHEMMAVLMRGAELSHGYVPRNVQILSVLSCLCQNGRGRFLQVKTGEGKSLITAMLAASKVLLEDISVDVLSSSEILAERDANMQQKFYSMFDIMVGFKDKSIEGAVDFYQKHQVIYGDMSQLIGDTLRQSYMGHPTRGHRPFAALIIDEVDSLLVDRVSMIVKLTTPLACSESLLPFLQLLWLQLNELDQTELIPDIEYEEKIEQILQEFCDDILNGTHQQFQLTIPDFLKEFVRRQIPQWIRSARQAKVMQYGIHYLYLKNDKSDEPGTIKIVDFEHTGVIEDNMVWGFGLHQFLQLKHDGCVYPETLTSCFASADAYISRYKSNVFGLTGTLGDQLTRQMIRNVYGVSLLDIPTYTAKTFTEHPGRLCAAVDTWKKEVVAAIQKETRKSRSVLVVNENILRCCEIAKLLEPVYSKENVQLYVRNSQDIQTFSPVKPGKVILTTNLGGRGTDLETTPEVEQAGGMHVLVTFLPANQRVEDQAFGRTSRQGRKGSAQLLVLKSSSVQTVSPFIDQTDTIDQLRAMRKLKEDQRIKSVQHETMARTRLNDQLFHGVDVYMRSLLHGLPLQDHPEKEKIKQVDQLWALQQNRLENYKGEINHTWKQALRHQLKKWDLTLNNSPQADLDSLYTLAHLITNRKYTPSASALKAKVLSYLLAQKLSWTDGVLNQMVDTHFDTRNPPEALLEALCQATRSTYVCVDQMGQMRIARYHDDSAPVVCLGVTQGQTVVPDLDILKALYPRMAFTQPVRLEASQMPNNLYQLVFTNAQISDELRAKIQSAPKIAPTTYNFQTADHPKINDVLTKMEQKEQQWYSRFYDQEGHYQIQWVNQFIENLKTLYAQGDAILITPAYLMQLASQTTVPANAEALFARATSIPHLHHAMAYYGWANYIVRNQVGDYKAQALQKLEQCAEALQEQIQLWQCVSIFAGTQSANNPIGYQVHGRLSLYSHMLSNIHHNIQMIRAAGPKDKIVIHSEESLADLVGRINHFNAADVSQVQNLGLSAFSSYGVTPPESSFFDIFLVNVLGVFQTVVGAALTTAGIPFGSAILMSGLNDIWTGVKSMVTGVFTWETYFFNKSIEVLTVAVSHMYGVIKDNVLKVRNVASAVVATKSTMEEIVQLALPMLKRNIAAELMTGAVTVGVSGFRDGMSTSVGTKVDQLLAEPIIRTHLEHILCISALLAQPGAIVEALITRIQLQTLTQRQNMQQLLAHLAKSCITQHHSGSALGTVVSTAISGVQLAGRHHEVATCVDKYIQMLREEIIKIAQEAVPTIETMLNRMYQSARSTSAPSSDLHNLLSYLRSAGIFNGDRPYNVQRSDYGVGVRSYPSFTQLTQAIEASIPKTFFMPELSREQMLNLYLHGGSINLRPEALTLTRLIGMIFNHAYDYATNAEMLSLLRQRLTQFGTTLLFNKTVAFADDVARTTMETTQSLKQMFRTKVNETQKKYQELERAEQAKIAEQKRVEKAKAAEAQQKARQEAAADSARRAALEKNTAYTRTLARYLQSGQSDSSAVLRGYYRDVAIATNRNRARTKSPPRSSDTFGHRAGSTVITHTPVIVKEVIGSGLQVISRVIEWSAEMFPRTAAVVGNALNAVDHVTAEVPSTHTRRTLRDRLGAPQGIAQDVGDVVGFAVGMFIPGKAGKTVMNVSRAVAGVSDAAKAVRVANTTTSGISRVVASTEQVASGNMTRMAAGSAAIKRSSSAVRIGEKSVWQELPLTRGEMIEEALGKNLHRQFPTIDSCFVENQTAISIKSRDLLLPTYQDSGKLASRVRRDIDKVADFTEGRVGKEVVQFGEHFTKRELTLAVPEGISVQQLDVLRQMEQYAVNKGVKFNVVTFA